MSNSYCTFTGLVYTYLAGHVGRSSDQGAFRALTRGYAHWASGKLDNLEINTNNPKYCHIRAIMKPSMNTGLYNVYLLLESDQDWHQLLRPLVNLQLGVFITHCKVCNHLQKICKLHTCFSCLPCIERNTKDQRFSSLWFSSSHYRITQILDLF